MAFRVLSFALMQASCIGQKIQCPSLLQTQTSDRLESHADKTESKLNGATAPKRKEQNEVNTVWEEMRNWGGRKTGAVNIGMYMKDNSMQMDNTEFSFSGTMPAGDDNVAPPDAASDSDQGPSTVRKMDLAACALGKYMQDDSMEMLGNSLTINGVTETTDKLRVDAPSLVQVQAAAPTNMYMYQNTLSMKTTVFTMNVGAAAASFLQQPAPPGASVMSLQDLNINMFMYHNEMTMTDTNFQMNVGSIPFSPNLQTAGILGGDLARILLLNVLTMSNAAENMDVQFGDNRETDDTNKVWKWLKGWSPSSSVAATSANINMHMYDNKMSMDGTHFKMNVGSNPKLAELAFNETLHSEGAINGTAAAMTNETVSAPAKEWKLYRSGMDMKNTEFSISVGSLLQEDRAAPVPGPGSDINMYMYNNEMSMKTTDFTMNVGNVPASLLQASAQQADAQSMVMNAGRLNIRMYMYKNGMSMKDTDFSWTVGS